MPNPSRRLVLGGFAASLGALADGPSLAADDGHAAGHDVAPAGAADHLKTIPRRTGDPVTFTASLDKAPLKATSGGWAREITSRQLPIATGMAGAHLFIEPGGVREMHWHNSAEWAYVLDGRCQVTVVDPNGETEVANFAGGDLWYFPAGHAHAIQTLGSDPCHAILVFNDGLYGEHGTFGLTDWVSRLDPGMLGVSLGLPPSTFAAFPPGETYIMRGPVIAPDGPQAQTTNPVGPEQSHRHELTKRSPVIQRPGGSLRLASAREFPLSADMSGLLLRLEPGGVQTPHWHPNADEWLYVAQGRARATLFAADKRLSTAEISAGDCAYFPRNCGHTLENLGDGPCEIVAVTDSGRYVAAHLGDWFAFAPRHLIAANLGLDPEALPSFNPAPERIAKTS